MTEIIFELFFGWTLNAPIIDTFQSYQNMHVHIIVIAGGKCGLSWIKKMFSNIDFMLVSLTKVIHINIVFYCIHSKSLNHTFNFIQSIIICCMIKHAALLCTCYKIWTPLAVGFHGCTAAYSKCGHDFCFVEVAEVCLFLACDRSSFVTGATIDVTGRIFTEYP